MIHVPDLCLIGRPRSKEKTNISNKSYQSESYAAEMQQHIEDHVSLLSDLSTDTVK